MSEQRRNHIRWLLNRLGGPHTWQSENERKKFYALYGHFIPEMMALDEAVQMLKDKLKHN